MEEVGKEDTGNEDAGEEDAKCGAFVPAKSAHCLGQVSRNLSNADIEEELRAAHLELERQQEFRSFDSISRMLTSDETLEPIAAFDHPLPVLTVLLNAAYQGLDLCVCCDLDGGVRKRAFVYRVLVRKDLAAEPQLLQTIDMNVEVQVDYAVRFTLSGHCLLFVGARPCDLPADDLSGMIRVVSVHQGVQQLEIPCSGVRCLLVTGPASFIAGGFDGLITRFQVDWNWRCIQDVASLPVAVCNGARFGTVTELCSLPTCPHIVIGADAAGSLATWNVSTGQLLSVCPPSQYRLQKLQPIDSSLIDKSSPKPFYLLADASNVDGHAEHESFWTMAALRDSRVTIGSKLNISSCSAVVAVGRYGAAGTSDGRVVLWELSTGNFVAELLEQDSSIVALTGSPAPALASVSRDGRVILYV